MANTNPPVAQQIIARIFQQKFQPHMQEVPFTREDIESAARQAEVPVPKNLGDVVYSLRYRTRIPEALNRKAPPGREWAIFPAGRSHYVLRAVPVNLINPNPGLQVTLIPDSTPGVIAMHSLSDEQALLAKIRYNRLLDVFTGLACYPLQSHLRTSIAIGDAPKSQVETDDLYVGVDKHGAHHILPVQAKGARDDLRIIQIWQDFRIAEQKFPKLIARPVAAKFMHDDVIALFEFKEVSSQIRIASERHYTLAPPDQLTHEELDAYRIAAQQESL